MKWIIFLLLGLLPANDISSFQRTSQNLPVTAVEEYDSEKGNTATEVWTSADASVCAWFDEKEPEDFMGINTEPLKMYAGKEMFSFIRLPMQATWFKDEIDNARLYLNVAEGEAPPALRVGLIDDPWSGSVTALADAQKVFDRAGIEQTAVRQEQDGWISLDITNYVAEWLNGDVPNYGLVLFGTDEEAPVAFDSDWNGETANPPRLEVTGATGDRPLTYGKFGYIRHPLNERDDAEIEENEVANCLSYALRDTNMITAEDLQLNYEEMTSTYRKSGEDAVADYCAGMISDYVDAHGDGLQISGFRRIDDFDSEINPEKEYRIVLRVGCDLFDETDVFDPVAGNFDFHLWAQINNGRWAQKFLDDPTEIVPCTPPGVSPAKYPWDAQLEWGYDKFDGFYTSKAIYFAVTKDTDGFTGHKAK